MARKPAVFVPGFPGCSLHDTIHERDIFPPALSDLAPVAKKRRALARLQGPDDVSVDDGVTTNGVIEEVEIYGFLTLSREAATLFEILGRLGYERGEDFVPVPWDWRLPVYHPRTLDRLRAAIDGLVSIHDEKVVVIGHSTGGLVIRALLERAPEAESRRLAERIDHVLALGVPWAGTLKTLRYLAVGESQGPLKAEDFQMILGHSWAAFDLMPPDPVSTDMTDASGNPLDFLVDVEGVQTSPLVDHRWMRKKAHLQRRAKASHRELGARRRTFQLPDGVEPIPVTIVAGWGEPTDTTFQLTPKGQKVNPAETGEGDRTVPLGSATWLRGEGVRHFALPVGLYEGGFLPRYHGQLWDTPPARGILASVLTDAPLPPLLCAALDNEAVLDQARRVAVRVAALDAEGRPLPRARAAFAPGAHQGGDPIDLVEGRGCLTYLRGSPPPSKVHRCPVRIEWEDDEGVQAVELARSFMAR